MHIHIFLGWARCLPPTSWGFSSVILGSDFLGPVSILFRAWNGWLQKITFPSTRKVFRLESNGISQQGQNRKRMCSVLRCGCVAGGLLCCLLVRISKSFIIILWHRVWHQAPIPGTPWTPPLSGIGHLNRW